MAVIIAAMIAIGIAMITTAEIMITAAEELLETQRGSGECAPEPLLLRNTSP
jgi:hypothetical protein